VILDPPYDFAALDAVVALAGDHLLDDGLLIVEHASRRSPPTPNGLTVLRTVRSGDSALSFFATR
jgi:16S rRNA G966 N2-methylase RsmD